MIEFYVTDNTNDLDFEFIHNAISNSYWAKNIPRVTMQKAIANSLVFGAYKSGDQQIGFARVVTDKATFAYLGDVFVSEDYRGIGVSKRIMEAVIAHPDLQGLRRFMLATQDAHGLYATFGFTPVENPEILMQILTPDIYN